jgi:aminoglycoside 6-adenylyltransferase
MRSEHQIMTSLLNVANADKRVRAVLLNGSRANPNIKKDMLQDYDIVYVVDEIAAFKNDPAWIDIFGERLILQMPDEMETGYEMNKSLSLHYLMLFKDMNRIDLTIFPKSQLQTQFKPDSLTIVRLDKDNLFQICLLPMTWIIMWKSQLKKCLPTAVTNFGGFAQMLQKGCGEMKSLIPWTCLMYQ